MSFIKFYKIRDILENLHIKFLCHHNTRSISNSPETQTFQIDFFSDPFHQNTCLWITHTWDRLYLSFDGELVKVRIPQLMKTTLSLTLILQQMTVNFFFLLLSFEENKA